jgi:hypothetical protein
MEETLSMVCPQSHQCLAGVTQWKKIEKLCPTDLYFQRFSIGVSFGLTKGMFGRDRSRHAGSEALGEGRERFNFIGTISQVQRVAAEHRHTYIITHSVVAYIMM